MAREAALADALELDAPRSWLPLRSLAFQTCTARAALGLARVALGFAAHRIILPLFH
jgi:hypothetical protein